MFQNVCDIYTHVCLHRREWYMDVRYDTRWTFIHNFRYWYINLHVVCLTIFTILRTMAQFISIIELPLI